MRRHLRPSSLLIVLLVFAACVDPDERGADSAGLRDPWTDPAPVSDATRAAGKQIFASCASCHLADAGGRSDGTIPRLAGQPASILEGRLRALADGLIDLPVMTPFARALTDTEIHQVSAYVSSLPRPEQVGIGPGTRIEHGAAIYTELCVVCHTTRGMGRPELNAPRLCGQHEAYLLRRLGELADGSPRLGDPAMGAIAAALSVDDRRAVSDYLARRRCE